MHGLKVEHRPLPNKTYLARDIAAHIAKGQAYTRIVIVANNPKQMLKQIRKEWGELIEEYEQQKDFTDDKDLRERFGYRGYKRPESAGSLRFSGW